MPNVMITGVCNLRCPYCFANDEMISVSDSEMKFDRYKQALTILNSWRVPHIGIIGGEPTLHSQFTEMVNWGLKATDSTFTIFTNGLTLDKFGQLFSNPRLSVLVNFNSPKVVGTKKYKALLTSIKRYSSTYYSENLSLGVNVYDTDLRHIMDAIELGSTIGLKKLRLSITVPNAGVKDMIEYHRGFKSTYLDICRFADSYGIAVGQDCNYMPACVFSDAELDELAGYTSKYQHLGVGYIDSTVCEPVLDINKDLEVMRCFGVQSLRTSLLNYDDLYSLQAFFRKNFDRYARRRLESESCNSCLREYTHCNQGCLRNKLDYAME